MSKLSLTRQKELIGKKINRWKILSIGGIKSRSRMVNCVCDCGAKKQVRLSALEQGKSVSCGCYQKENMSKIKTKHGMEKSKTYRVWAAMKKRCKNPNSKWFHRYGGRGIKVCERWHRFENFLSDMGEQPKGLDLDRIDNNGGYSPENCRWTTRKINVRNSTTAKLDIDDVMIIKSLIKNTDKSMSLIGRLFGVHRRTITDIRLNKTWSDIKVI